jgi:hypothetical protein
MPESAPVSTRTGSGMAADAAALRMQVKAKRENGPFMKKLP